MKWIIITTVFFFIGRTDTFSQGTYNIGAGFNPKQEDLTGYLELIDTLDQHFDFTQMFFKMKWSELTGEILDSAYTVDPEVQINNYLVNLIHQNNIYLLISLDITHSTDRSKLNFPLDSLTVPGDTTFQHLSVSQAYINEVKYIAQNYNPTYLALAVEIDEYIFSSDTLERQALLNTISTAIDSVKNINSSIKTFVYFQYENTLCNNLWELIKPFADSSDLFVFSSYPFAKHLTGFCFGTDTIYGNNLPLNYFDTIADVLGNAKPIAIAEIGEPTESNSILPQASEQNQKEFINRLKLSISNLNVEFINWTYLHDIYLPDSVGGNHFNSMGLMHDTTGIAKAGYPYYINHITSLIKEIKNKKQLLVYPNPSRDIFNITFISQSKQSIEIRVVNLVGEIIFTENLENFEGEYTHSFNLLEYSKGVYLLELDTDNGIINKKLILQ